MTKAQLGDIKNNYVPLELIEGVDIDNLVYDRPTNALTPKIKVRQDVLDLLEQAGSPDDIPPIEIANGSVDGKFRLVDGEHRIINALTKIKKTGDASWSRIKTSKTAPKSETEYLARAVTLSLEENSGKLNDAETFAAVSKIVSLSNNKEEAIKLLGERNLRIVNMVEKIMNNASPEVADAVKTKNVSLDTATKISKLPKSEQGTIAKVAGDLKTAGLSDTVINKSLGLRKAKSTLIRWKDAVEYALGAFKDFHEGYQKWDKNRDDKNAKSLDHYVTVEVATRFETCCMFFGLDTLTFESQIDYFQNLEAEASQ